MNATIAYLAPTADPNGPQVVRRSIDDAVIGFVAPIIDGSGWWPMTSMAYRIGNRPVESAAAAVVAVAAYGA